MGLLVVGNVTYVAEGGGCWTEWITKDDDNCYCHNSKVKVLQYLLLSSSKVNIFLRPIFTKITGCK